MKRVVVSGTSPLWPPYEHSAQRAWQLFAHLPADRFIIDYVGLQCDRGEPYVVTRRAEHVREFLIGVPQNRCRNGRRHHTDTTFFHAEGLCFDKKYLRGFKPVIDHLPADVFITAYPQLIVTLPPRNGQKIIYDMPPWEYRNAPTPSPNNLHLKTALKQWREIEQKVCSRSDAILVGSLRDKNTVKELYGVAESAIHIVPDGAVIAALPTSAMKEAAKNQCGFQGKTIVLCESGFVPSNREAADFVMHTLAPMMPEFVFVVMGPESDAVRQETRLPNVCCTGMISANEAEQWLLAADIAVHPSKNGSQRHTHLFSYLAHGLATVTTPYGIQGLPIEHRSHAMIVSREEFPAAIGELAGDPVLARTLSHEGYALAAEHYNWNTMSAYVENFLEALMTTKTQ